MRNAVHVLLGAMLATALACGGDDESSENPAFHNPGTSGFNGGGAASGASGASGAAGASGTGGLPTGCAEGTVRASRVTPRVILLLDGSCSMSTDYPSRGGQSASMCTDNPNGRWSALRNALLGNNGIVTRLEGLVEFGLVVFGTQPMCPITADPIMASLNNAAAIQGAVGNTPPGMFTPTGAALDYVYRNLIEPTRPDSDMGPQIVLLATDGEPNSCDDAQTNYQPSIDAANYALSQGITTYVVSLANSQGEFHDHLQQLANLGKGMDANSGTAKLYEPDTPEQLAADLELLIGGAIGCDIALNGEVNPNAACQGSVTLNGQPIACNDPNGWMLVDSRHIRLQGSACDQLMRDMNVSLKADFACSIFDPD